MLEKLAEALRESLDSQKRNSVAMSVQVSVQNSRRFNATSQKILAVIIVAPAITIIQLAENLGVNRRTIECNIKILQDAEYLIRIGAKKRWLLENWIVGKLCGQ
ncbi:HTH domain-containing protein [Xenorhabdus hominickii]|nr:HTH domain-containing protein [Xenorhabdus hominickii]